MINFFKKAIKNYLRRRNADKFKKLVGNFEFKPVLQEKPHGGKIAFVLPAVDIYGGGVNSVLRLADGLSKRGLEIYVVSLNETDEEKINQNIAVCLGVTAVKGVCKNTFECVKFDILIATAWQTAYYIYPFEGYKMYFVQDYEPYFYERGDFYYLAYKSYGLGYHMVSLGGWNKKKVTENYPAAKVDEICFPFDPSVYGNITRQKRNVKNKTLTAAVYLRYTPRRLPLMTEVICKNLVEKFAADGFELQVFYFGDDKKIKIDGGTNLGKLKKDELAKLYSECDFGMVFSYTNISLVPYEMMAAGLPLVELKEGTFTEFMPENAAVLYDGACEKLYEELKKRIFDEEYFEETDRRNKRLLRERNWEKATEDMIAVLNGVENGD